MANLNRRTFLAGATAATLALTSRRTRAADANDTVVLALMGANNRGSQLVKGFAGQAGAEFAYVCDCDERALEKGINEVVSNGGRKPKGVKDFRKVLDDPAVDALVCAAPNHWHAAATILACAAGKHVYVEKPVSHTPDEGQRMIAAARGANRVVQVGLQRRSGPLYRKMIDRVRDGAIGRVLYAGSKYFADRPTIGHGKQTSPPSWLDYDLWQGPAPARPYQDNLIHYNWHFFWHWGNGELGNNGVHTIDLCRWALGVDYPSKVTAWGAKLRFDDDQETPDTCTVIYDCDGRLLVWEGISWTRRNDNKSQIGIDLRGENGAIYVDDSGYTIYDPTGKAVESEKLGRGDAEHLQNFLDAVRNGASLNMDIEEGHKSTMFCHLGNIAYRTGQPLAVDSSTGHIVNNPAAEALWSREYRDGWMPNG
ncbi:MAG: Gfo/Idh/MocA family oxidoreductase [Planctomycetes bacterium]|nr:Gfo/Idh/MocA family oxidoreductase [Planctomycetota bacterium]